MKTRADSLKQLPGGFPQMVAAAVERTASERHDERLEAEKCQKDLIFWLENFVHIENPKAPPGVDKDLPFKLWPKQKRIARFLLSGYVKADKRLLNKAREIGATWLASAILYWLWWKDPGFSALCLSAVERKVDDKTSKSIFGKLQYIHDHLPKHLQGKLRYRYLYFENMANKAVIVGAATSKTVGRSERYAIVLSDEWAHVERRFQQPIRVALETVARSWWKITTPNGRGEEFHTDWLRSSKEQKLQLDWRTNPERTQGWFDGTLDTNGGDLTYDQREQEHACSFRGISGERILQVSGDKPIEYDDNDLPIHARQNWFYIASMDFGSGPSWTVCYWLLVTWEMDDSPLPHIFVDRELIAQRQSAFDIGPRIVEVSNKYYSNNYMFVGDPAGRAKESDQESWESRLRQTGVPITCLPGEANSPQRLDENIRESQMLIDAGRLHIHRENCPIALECVDGWKWALPENVPLELVSRETISPMKDKYSHPGDAIFRYGVGTAMRVDTQGFNRMAKALEKIPPQEAKQIDDVLARLDYPVPW